MLVSDLIAISVSTLSPSSVIGADLYCRVGSTEEAKLYRGANYPMKSQDLNKLKSRGVTKLFIEREGRSSYQEYLRDMAAGGGDESVTNSQRSAALNEVVLDVLKCSFAGNNEDTTVSAASELGGLAAKLVSRDDFAAGDLFRVLHHDYATFTHSANVALYAGMLADELGMNQREVELVVAGGLLHDLGKLEIPDQILTKPGRLDEDEFAIIKKHPGDGFRQLALRDDLTFGQLMMVYQHHERLDGGGYPVGSAGDEIHPWGRLCAVVDIYEAVTSQRPYRTPMSREDACNLIRRESGKALDPEMVECWISIIQSTMPK
ncbi:HD-GYP domain protein [Rhodopirellula islandica]|uniref:HD-GYP domain protein n=1 Tax=Rhodopirellula islandica TaxID=595434 RepID=A0A0J1BCH6_RHOIS|nr:HD domain-containing phosphohydrolase [Rhodopirellula islandica]KLU04302.1 HD-GYP domain protein [Rhodopirellula islandica]